jgi:hypothetical protein
MLADYEMRVQSLRHAISAADAEIEAFILSRCIRRKRKMDATPRTVNAGNYYDIQRHFKEYNI